MAFTNRNSSGQVRKGLVITTAGGLLYTLDLPLLRLSLADPWDMVFARGIFLFLSLAAICLLDRWWRGSRGPFIAGIPGLAVVISITMSSICYVAAVTETNAANVVFISALIPLITAMFSHIFVGERVRPVTWLATVIAFTSVAAIVWDSIGAGNWYGDLMALFAAFYTAATFSVIRASGKNVVSSIAVGSLMSALVAAFFFGASPVALLSTASYGLPAWVWLAINGLLAIPIASTLFANGPRYLPSTDVSMFFLLETVLTPIWVWMIFAEVPSATVLVSGVVVTATLIAHGMWRLNVLLDSPKTVAEY